MARRKKEINIKLVAQEAAVSVATVSRVVNNRTDVSEAVRQKVQSVIEKFNFSPTKSVERRVNIGVIVSIEHPVIDEYCAQLLDGIAKYSGGNNVDVTVILNCQSVDHKPLLQTIRERRCDAVVLIVAESVLEEVKEIERAEIPTMLINSALRGEKMGYVNNDSYNGAFSAVSYLIQLGHRQIGFLCNAMENNDNHQQRLRGYRDALEKSGVPIAEPLIVPHQPTTHTPEAGYRQAGKLLDNNSGVTAIFCTNDEMAMGALKACWERKLRVPEDISVMGFDDIPYASYTHPALTTVRQPLSELGYRAVKYLDMYMKGVIGVLPTEVIGTELVVRESTSVARG